MPFLIRSNPTILDNVAQKAVLRILSTIAIEVAIPKPILLSIKSNTNPASLKPKPAGTGDKYPKVNDTETTFIIVERSG